jgi:hypothetical protein
MFFGGWLYPDAVSAGVAGGEVTFDENEADCARMGTDVAQTISAPAKRKFKGFRTGMSSLR